MNQVKTGFKLFFQSIILTFKHVQLYLYIGAYFVAHHLLNYFLFPSPNLDIQPLNEGITMTGDYKAGISSSFNTLFLLGLLFNLISFIFFYVLIIGITDYTSHILHNHTETMIHSIKKGFSKLGNIIGYGFLKLFFIYLAMYSILYSNFSIRSLQIILPILFPAIVYLVFETITFYFFITITLSNTRFFEALKKSFRMILKTFFAVIVFLMLWTGIVAMTSLLIPAFTGMPQFKLHVTLFTAITSIFSYTIFTVFKTILYEKANGTLPKQYDPEK